MKLGTIWVEGIWAMSQQNLSLWFLTRSDTNRAVQAQKMIRGTKMI